MRFIKGQKTHQGMHLRITDPLPQLHLFVFDETYDTIQGWGSAVNIATWYASPSVSICHACFVCDTEEILLIDSGRQARVFSLITQQFR